MAYRNECHFLKVVEDDANPATAPDIIEPDSSVQNNAGAQSEHQGFSNPQPWAGDQQMSTSSEGASTQNMNMPGIPVVSPRSASLFDGVKSPSTASALLRFVQDESGGDPTDLSASPGARSGGPTSNSSTASEQHKSRIGAGMNGSGSTSYDASPSSAHQTLKSQAGVDGQGGFYDTGGYPLSGQPVAQGQRYQVPQASMEFGMSNDWAHSGMQTGQAGVSAPVPVPVPDGVLRSLMNMGPMDAMDLSSWESGN